MTLLRVGYYSDQAIKEAPNLCGTTRATPWVTGAWRISPERAPQTDADAIVSPFQGWRIIAESDPRALPWADLLPPLRGEYGQPLIRLKEAQSATKLSGIAYALHQPQSAAGSQTAAGRSKRPV
jgi:hypothetical protein